MPETNFKNIVDERIFELAQMSVRQQKYRFIKNFFQSVGISQQTATNVRIGLSSFTVTQILRIIEKTDVDANWLMGKD